MVAEAFAAHRRDDGILRDTRRHTVIQALLTQHGEPLHGRRGTWLNAWTSPGPACYLVAAGAVRHYRLSRDGGHVTLTVARQDHVSFLVGGQGGVDDQQFDHLEALANGTLVFALTMAQLRLLLPTHPELTDSLFDLFSSRLAEAHALIASFALHDIRTRLARTLVRLAEGQGLVVASHEELAGDVGAARADVTRALRALQSQGLIRYGPGRRRIVLLDPARLADLQP